MFDVECFLFNPIGCFLYLGSGSVFVLERCVHISGGSIRLNFSCRSKERKIKVFIRMVGSSNINIHYDTVACTQGPITANKILRAVLSPVWIGARCSINSVLTEREVVSRKSGT